MECAGQGRECGMLLMDEKVQSKCEEYVTEDTVIDAVWSSILFPIK